MRSKTDDLEELLQQNLKLRRDLVAEVARANKPRRVTGWGSCLLGGSRIDSHPYPLRGWLCPPLHCVWGLTGTTAGC